MSLLFKNTVFYDKRIRRSLLDLPLVKGLKARPDKENPGPTPFKCSLRVGNRDRILLYCIVLYCIVSYCLIVVHCIGLYCSV